MKKQEMERLVGYATALIQRDFSERSYEVMGEWRERDLFIRITEMMFNGEISQPAEWSKEPKWEGHHDWMILDAMARLYFYWMSPETTEWIIESYESTFDVNIQDDDELWGECVDTIDEIITAECRYHNIDSAFKILEDVIIETLAEEGVLI